MAEDLSGDALAVYPVHLGALHEGIKEVSERSNMTDTSSERWLVLKGVAGFGDRLATLGTAIQLAVMTKRTLVIDWFDSSWAHDISHGFFHYFDLELPPSVSVIRGDAETHLMLKQLNTETSVYPATWIGNLSSRKHTYNRVTILELNGSKVATSPHEIIVADTKIAVFAAYGYRGQEKTVPFLRFRYSDTIPRYDIGVHFRNTDKHNNLDAILTQMKHVWKPGRSIYFATDDAVALRVVRETFGDVVHGYEPPPPRSTGGGIHHTPAEELAAVGKTKEELNIEMIRDILILCDTVLFIPSSNSCFSWTVEAIRDLKHKRKVPGVRAFTV